MSLVLLMALVTLAQQPFAPSLPGQEAFPFPLPGPQQLPFPLPVPGPQALAPLPPPAVEEAGPHAPRGTLIRLADPVALLDGEARAERHLLFWDKNAPLRVGDGLRQGVAGVCEIAFTDFTQVRHFGATHAFLVESGASGHVLRYHEVRRITADVRPGGLALILPGGYELRAADTWFRVSKDEFDRRYVVRNAGPGEVRIAGPFAPKDVAAVAAGHEVALPLPDDASAATQRAPAAADVFEGRVVRVEAGVSVERGPAELTLAGDGSAHVGGARIRLQPGGTARLWRPRP